MNKKISNNLLLLIIVFAGVLTQAITMFKSGLVYEFGMGFWGANAHDGLWHIALINQLAQGSFSFPVFSGVQITNYHIGFDLFATVIHKVTSLPVIFIYFQLLPILFSIFYGVLTYLLSFKMFNDKTAAVFSVFFAYFGGSFGWIVNLIRNEPVGGESMFWSMQSVSFLVNPPFIFSVILLLLGLILYLNYLNKKNISWFIAAAIVFGVLIQVKVYAGIVALGAILLTGLTEFVVGFLSKKKVNTPKILLLFTFSFLISLLVFLPLNFGSQSLLVYRPWWFIETMFSFPDRLNWPRMEALRQIYILTESYFKYTLWITLGTLIFLIGNVGSRIVGLFWFYKGVKETNSIPIRDFLTFSIIISFLPTLFFIQKGTNWNTIQFFYYFLVFLNFLGGWVISKSLKNKGLLMKFMISVLVVSSTLPTTITTLKDVYLPNRPPVKISKEELDALKFLTQQTNEPVLTYPFETYRQHDFTEPRPLYVSYTTAYVSALSNKVVFLEDEMNLQITNQNYALRKEQIIGFFNTRDRNLARSFLLDNKIGYVYLLKSQKMALNPVDIGLENIFNNAEVVIYRVS